MSLTIEQLRALDALVQTGLDQPATTRRAWFDTLVIEPPALRPLLQRALFADGNVESGTFMGTVPKIERAAREATDLSAGDIVGPYRLEALLGEGGSASVWRAQRTDGTMKRAVALKLPYFVGNTRGWAERIERERDVLASLNHPNVATIYDAGIADNGRPWLALELINGERIDYYARAKKITGDALVRLFLPAVRAIEHAHARGVIHRDVKPHNILVAENDRHEAQLKLLDFGIAKLQNDFANEQGGDSELTRIHGRPFTPEYASLEQLRGETITTATDIYALGVVFYELLCGNRPFDTSGDAGSLRKLEQRIATDAPIAPSQHLADKRSSSHALAIPSDLDAIALKALHRDNDKRYQTASAFAEDLERCLRRETISAQADSGVYRAKQFVKRNRLWVGASAGVAVSLFAGLGAALWQAQEARAQGAVAEAQALRATSALVEVSRQQTIASDAAKRADLNAALAQQEALRSDAQSKRATDEAGNAKWQTQIAQNASANARQQAERAEVEAKTAKLETEKSAATRNYLMKLFKGASGNEIDAQRKQRQTLLQLVREAPAQLDAEFVNQPKVKAELITTLAEIHSELLLFNEALLLHDRAIDLAGKYNATSTEVARAMLKRALVHHGLGKYTNSVAEVGKARALVQENTDAQVPLVLAEANAVEAYAQSWITGADMVAVKALATRATEVMTRSAPKNDYLPLALAAHARAERVLVNFPAETLAWDRAIETAERIYGTINATVANYRIERSSSLFAQQRFAEAFDESMQVVNIRSLTSGETSFLGSQAKMWAGRLSSFMGNAEKGAQMISSAIRDREAMSEVPRYTVETAYTILIETLLLRGRVSEARAASESAVKRVWNEPDKDIEYQAGSALYWFGIQKTFAGDYATAVAALERNIKYRSHIDKTDSNVNATSRMALARARFYSGDRTTAIAELKKLVGEPSAALQTPGSAKFRSLLSLCTLDEAMPHEEASKLLNQALKSIVDEPRNKMGETQWLRVEAEVLRAIAEISLRDNTPASKAADAIAYARKVVAYSEKAHYEHSPVLAYDRTLLARLLSKQGQISESAALLKLAQTSFIEEKNTASHFQIHIEALALK
jgi:serine/threonine protein kinase